MQIGRRANFLNQGWSDLLWALKAGWQWQVPQARSWGVLVPFNLVLPVHRVR